MSTVRTFKSIEPLNDYLAGINLPLDNFWGVEGKGNCFTFWSQLTVVPGASDMVAVLLRDDAELLAWLDANSLLQIYDTTTTGNFKIIIHGS